MRPRLTRRRRPVLVLAAAAALALIGPAPLAAGAELPAEVPGADATDPGAGSAERLGTPGRSARPPAPIPGVDEIVSSRNLRQLANVPFQDPFTDRTIGSDIAFQGTLAYQGNFNGFVVYDIADPDNPAILSQVLCPGSQNDISVSGNLLFLSTDSTRSDDSCQSTGTTDPVNYWEGIKIFDISDPRNPQYIKSVETDCGSHTHTLVPDKAGEALYLYVSSYFLVGLATPIANCVEQHDTISIVRVPLADPTQASVVAEPDLFVDDGGGNPGDPNASFPTTGCHDITVYPAKDLAAGACMGDGLLLDIADRENPRVIERVRDNENFAFWHSATFNNAGTKVVFTDELGGGVAAVCNAATGPDRGANGIYDIAGTGDDRTLTFRSYYKIPRHNADTENCVAHNGSLIPVAGRDLMVQAWYQGGISVWDFTNSANPREIAYWERGPLPAGFPLGGSWSAYWYNGHIYSSDIVKGLDVLRLDDPRVRTALPVTYERLNVQTQPAF